MSRPDIEKVTVQRGLAPRREPYWGVRLSHGLFLGFRRLDQGGTWIVRHRDDEGRQRYHSIGYADDVSYDEAVKAARQWAKQVHAGVDTSEVQTVADACRAYVADRRREKGDANADDAAGRFSRTVYRHAIGQIRLSKLRSADLKDWRAVLDMSDASKNRYLVALKAALNFAVASRYVDTSRTIEWQGVKPATVTTRRDLYLTRDQRAQLIAALPEHARPFVRLLCLLPLRPGALARANVGDFKHNSLLVRHDKAGGGRTIALASAAVEILREQALDRKTTAPLVAFSDGTAWDRNRWKAVINAAAKRADLPAQTCAYTLRHCVLTDMLIAGMDSLTVAKMAGTSIAMIEKFYGHLLHRHATAAMAKLEL